MKKEVRQLREKAINSLLTSIEWFNRPWNCGRTEIVLIMLDHAFEMLLKAAILHKNGKIKKSGENQTIGFKSCVQEGLDNTKFLTKEQALTLQAINGQRNSAQHYLVDMSERQLYFYTQAGTTLFRDIHDNIFNKKLVLELPERVLPVSTVAPNDLLTLFDKEVEEIKNLLIPGTRRKMDAAAKVRSLVVLDSVVSGSYEQPSDRELRKACKRLSDGEGWPSVFPGVASIKINPESNGPALSLRLTKKEGVAVQLFKEGEGNDGIPVAVRRVNELDFYNLRPAQLAKKVKLTQPKARAVVDHLNLRQDCSCFKEIKIGEMKHALYSHKAIEKIEDALRRESIDNIWATHQAEQRKKRKV